MGHILPKLKHNARHCSDGWCKTKLYNTAALGWRPQTRCWLLLYFFIRLGKNQLHVRSLAVSALGGGSKDSDWLMNFRPEDLDPQIMHWDPNTLPGTGPCTSGIFLHSVEWKISLGFSTVVQL